MWINKLMKKRREMVIHSFHNTRSDNSVELIEHKKMNHSIIWQQLNYGSYILVKWFQSFRRLFGADKKKEELIKTIMNSISTIEVVNSYVYTR